MTELKMYFPGKLVMGKGALERLTEDITAWNPERVLVVTIFPLLPLLKGLIDSLEARGVVVSVDTGIVQEPTFADFRELMSRAAPFNPDVVIGAGGGSVLDIAKLVAAQVGNPQPLEAYVGNGLLQGRYRKLVCLPATAGTGSEASPNAILVDDTDNQKKGIISPYLVPDVVYIDPLLTLSVPPAVTAATGLDAFTHCLEAYTNIYAHPFIDMYALQGMKLIAENLVRAVRDGNDVDARAQLILGSLLGGFCLGPVNTAAVHALSYPLGSAFHLAHGLSNALLLPHVMEFNLVAAPRRYADVALALGCSRAATDEATARAGVGKVRALIRDCGIPSRLAEVGVSSASVPDLATGAMEVKRLLKNNPRPVAWQDAVDIFNAAL
ncbi:iron-containing alcohol dehydrogenase [Dinghuibacter silviterrae]|uniref:Alcohol dehydrogenase class IV n=1 Tax=Dinghuibacter silviterrae TaxID=1539049 RepID=A0A4R8DSY2_9BACT|nr:iron-containing alcohol dehydrogenase [Dinghuibacter silviterrae]TDX01392.1 alcohol dehydrogenase class IV [Dinghuibacter silviterrae]